MDSPISTPSTSTLLRRSWIAPEKPSALAAASRAASPAAPHSSVMPFHASSDISRLSFKPPMVCIRPSMACFCRTLVIFNPSSVPSAEPPSSSMRFKPSMKALSASEGVSFHACANSDEVMPATDAKPASLSPPDATADSMSDMVLLIAVPAASAPWPVAATAVDQARSSVAENPVMVPMDAMRSMTSMILSSSVALLLPRRTSASPKLSKSSSPMSLRMPASWPSCSAALSASRLVAISRFETVVAKPSSLSVATPSWPPMASISSRVAASVTWVRE